MKSPTPFVRVVFISAKLLVFCLWAVPQITLAADNWTGPVRVSTGFQVSAPRGWVWESLREESVTFRKGDALLEIGSDYGTKVKNTRLVDSLPDGTRIELHFHDDRMSRLLPCWHIIRAGRYITVRGSRDGDTVRDVRERAPNYWKDAVIAFAHTLAFVEPTKTVRHPVFNFEVDVPSKNLETHTWFRDWGSPYKVDVPTSSGDEIRIYSQAHFNRDEKWAQVWIYPASASLRTLDAVLDDITGFYAKNGITGGPHHRVTLTSGGNALYVEAPNTKVPYMAAVERGGQFFFVRADTDSPLPRPSGIWGCLFRPALEGVRPTQAPGQKATNKAPATQKLGRDVEAWNATLKTHGTAALDRAFEQVGIQRKLDTAAVKAMRANIEKVWIDTVNAQVYIKCFYAPGWPKYVELDYTKDTLDTACVKLARALLPDPNVEAEVQVWNASWKERGEALLNQAFERIGQQEKLDAETIATLKATVINSCVRKTSLTWYFVFEVRKDAHKVTGPVGTYEFDPKEDTLETISEGVAKEVFADWRRKPWSRKPQ